MTGAARGKSLLAHPKLAKTQTRQPTAATRQAGCKTSAVTRRKRQKTSRCQNATKATAARSADTYKRVAQCAASVPTRPLRLQASRPLSCDADLCRRRRRQNSIPQKCTASLGDGSPSTPFRSAPARTSSRSRRWRSSTARGTFPASSMSSAWLCVVARGLLPMAPSCRRVDGVRCTGTPRGRSRGDAR